MTLTGNPDFETKPSYNFTVVADDGGNMPTEQAVTLAVNNLDEVAPTITSGATATAINENSGAEQVVYTATANDSADISAGVTFSLRRRRCGALQHRREQRRGDADRRPELRGKPSYSFTVLADDGVNAPTEQAVTLAINNLDEVRRRSRRARRRRRSTRTAARTRWSTPRRRTIPRTSSAGVTFSLGGADASLFSIDETSGAVTLTGNPN